MPREGGLDLAGQAFAAFLDDLGEAGGGVLAIDGKTLRRSFDRAAGRSPLHVVTAFGVTAFGTEARLAIGQRAVAAGENEITAARALLATLTLEGMLVTGDAIHCQAETAALITARGGDWMFALKANRPAMRAEVAAFFDDPANPREAHETTDADHGRVETRTVEVTHDVRWLFSDRRHAGEPRLPGLAAIARVTSQRDAATATRFYVASAPMSPERFAAAIRGHWGIENRLHWVLDTAFDEDRARNRKDNGPENLAILRKLTLNVMRRSRPKLGITRKRKRSGWSDDFARTIIGQMR